MVPLIGNLPAHHVSHHHDKKDKLIHSVGSLHEKQYHHHDKKDKRIHPVGSLHEKQYHHRDKKESGNHVSHHHDKKDKLIHSVGSLHEKQYHHHDKKESGKNNDKTIQKQPRQNIDHGKQHCRNKKLVHHQQKQQKENNIMNHEQENHRSVDNFNDKKSQVSENLYKTPTTPAPMQPSAMDIYNNYILMKQKEDTFINPGKAENSR